MTSTIKANPAASQTWTSGDWVDPPHKEPPYNGLELTATPVYHPESHTLITLGIEIQDFTLAKTGAKLVTAFETIGDKAKDELPKPDGDVTVAGSLELLLANAPAGKVLLCQDLAWGLPDQRHHASGCILEVPLTEEVPLTATDIAETADDKGADSSSLDDLPQKAPPPTVEPAPPLSVSKAADKKQVGRKKVPADKATAGN